jgi:hypothetical protein
MVTNRERVFEQVFAAIDNLPLAPNLRTTDAGEWAGAVANYRCEHIAGILEPSRPI